ncbi:MFS transporter [Nocardia altamirensis]|uniref:MFS transporter n=1 Tax=Nocardia altamirensis TaxID=472158 RepID=UPI0008406600|nr:MFS transporter [Nocardia altamirensis]
MSTSAPARIDDRPPAEQQRRVLRVLVAAQALSGAGLAAGVTVGALLAQDMLGSTSFAGLSGALGTAGSALAAVAVGRISQARGRRPGLVAGYLTGAVGSAGVIAAAVAANPVLLFLAIFVYGAGTSTNMQARYAGADLADPAHRARAVSTVLVATTLGGVVGPNLTAPTSGLAHAIGIPHLAGPFLLAGVAYAMAAAVLAVWLRPDPLLLARIRAAEPSVAAQVPHPAVERRGSGVLVGTLIMVLAQLVMVAIMTMTPVHMHDHDHGSAATGLVIAIHIGAMYLPSPLTGWLVDRFGRYPVAAASGLTLLAAGIVAASAPFDSITQLAVALALLGIGWNFGLVTGSALITDAVPLATRATTQGLIDVAMAVAGAAGSMASGYIVAAAGFPVLSIGSGILALGMVPAVAFAARHGRRKQPGADALDPDTV